MPDFAFVHINKTGGTSIERALGLPLRNATAHELIAEMGMEEWRRRFTFAVVRNPWDKVVSHYAFRVQTNQTGLGDGHLPFKDWLKEAYWKRNPAYYDRPKMFMPQIEWISEPGGGRPWWTTSGGFETLPEDFRIISERIGCRNPLPHLKSSGRGDFRDYYDEESIEIVGEVFRRDIETWGYEF